MSLGYAVKTEEQVVVVLFQILRRVGRHGPDVIGMIVVGRHDRQRHVRRDFRHDFPDPLDGGFIAGHGVVRKKRDEQHLLDAFVPQLADGIAGWTGCDNASPAPPSSAARSCNASRTLRLVATRGEPSGVQIFS